MSSFCTYLSINYLEYEKCLNYFKNYKKIGLEMIFGDPSVVVYQYLNLPAVFHRLLILFVI